MNKQILKSNRIFLAPSNSSNITANLAITINSTTTSPFNITLDDATNFKEKGYIYINDEKFYYSSSNSTTLFNVYRGINNTTADTHLVNDSVEQTRESINGFVSSSNLAGWYSDGISNQLALRVHKTPVIMPGVIRYLPNDAGTSGTFQGCISDTSGNITWADFNATKGDKGDAGDINTIITFEHVSNIVISDSNSGNIIKNSPVDSNVSNVEVRSIITGNITVNQVVVDTMDIETTSNNVILSSVAQPYIYDLTPNTTVLKGSPASDSLLNCYGNQAKVNVVSDITKGQVVAMDYYTTGGNTFIGVKPFTYSALSELDKYKAVGTTPSFSFGIARETVSAGGTAYVLVNGTGILKIGNNVTGLGSFTTTVAVNYSGRPVLLDKDGYGFCNNTEPVLIDSYIELGTYLETGSTISTTGNYVLVNFNPKVITP